MLVENFLDFCAAKLLGASQVYEATLDALHIMQSQVGI
jgi:hypothetical protein